MYNTTIIVLGIIAIVIVIVAFICYGITTNRIIREQEKEIARLETQLRREKQRETLYIIQDGKNPKFGGF